MIAVVLLVGVVCVPVLGSPSASAHQPHDPFFTVALSPAYATDHTVFAGSSLVSVTLAVQLLLKSTDGGLTWQVLPFPNYQVDALALSPAYATDHTLFAATYGDGLLKSTDGGVSWTSVGTSLGSTVTTVALSPGYATDHTLFAATYGDGLFTSTDGGTSWRALPAAPSTPTVLALSPSYARDHTLFVGTASSGVLASTNGGTSWAAVSQGLPAAAPVLALAVSPSFATDHTLVAGAPGWGVFVSTNAGSTWAAANQGLGDLNVHSLALSPNYASDHTLFASTSSGRVYRSINGAQTWTPTAGITRVLSNQTTTHDHELAISPAFATDQTVFVAMFEGIWKSADAGGAWAYQDTLPPSLIRGLALSPAYSTDHTLLASAYGGGMLRSSDGGQSWQAQNTKLVNCYPDPIAIAPTYAADGTVFSGTGIGLEQATGAGSWQLYPLLGVGAFVRALAVSPNYGQDHTVVIGTDNLGTTNPATATVKGRTVSTNGLFVSTTGGQSWSPTTLNGIAIHTIAFSPQFATDHTLFAGSLNTGLYKSTTAGLTWSQVAGGLDACCVSHVVVSPQYGVDHTVFVIVPSGATGQRGLYRSTDGGTTWQLLASSQGMTLLTLALSPNFANDHTLFVGTLERGVLVSTNGGTTLGGSGLSAPYVTALSVSPAYASDRTVFAATYQGMYTSADGGQTWRPLPTTTRYEEERPSLIRSGSWTLQSAVGASCDAVLAASAAGASLQFTFKGSQIAWIGGKAAGYGLAQVYLDGVLQAAVDLYAPTYQPQQTLYQSPALSAQAHTLRIVVTGAKNAQATGTTVTLDALAVTHAISSPASLPAVMTGSDSGRATATLLKRQASTTATPLHARVTAPKPQTRHGRPAHGTGIIAAIPPVRIEQPLSCYDGCTW